MKIRSIAVATFKLVLGVKIGVGAAIFVSAFAKKLSSNFMDIAKNKKEESKDDATGETTEDYKKYTSFSELINDIQAAVLETYNKDKESNDNGGEEDGSEA